MILINFFSGYEQAICLFYIKFSWGDYLFIIIIQPGKYKTSMPKGELCGRLILTIKSLIFQGVYNIVINFVIIVLIGKKYVLFYIPF